MLCNVKLQPKSHLLGLSLWSQGRDKLFQSDGEQDLLSLVIDYSRTPDSEVLSVT